jgi:hypothetical protein
MNKEFMKTNKFTDKPNTKTSTNHAAGSRHVSAIPPHRQAIKTRNCLSSAELARRQARPTETTKRLSTVLSLALLGLLLARTNQHKPKDNNCRDSCLQSFSANFSECGGQNNKKSFTPKALTLKHTENNCTRIKESFKTSPINKRISKPRRKARKVRPVKKFCRKIILRQLIIPTSVGTRTRLAKINQSKTFRLKSPRGRKPPQDTCGRIINKNQIQGKVTPFPTTKQKTKAIPSSIFLGLKMTKKRSKKQVSDNTDISEAENLPPKEQALSRLRAARVNKARKRPRKSESEAADSSDDDKTPSSKQAIKTRKPKRRKKSSVPVPKIKQEIVIDQEAKKLSPV